MKLQKILKSRKGFTLMELIVVLIIVAILAAALIPSFLNFVSRAREDSLYAQARVGMVAAQVLLTENGAAFPVAVHGSGPFSIAEFEGQLTLPAGDENTFFYLVNGDVDDPDGFSNIMLGGGGRRVVGITYTDGTSTPVTITPRTTP